MHLDIKNKVTEHVLKQRNFAYVMCGFLMVVTLILLSKTLSKNEKVIIVPSLNEPQKQYHLDGTHIPDNYLVDWGFTLLGDLFTANPKTIQKKNQTFLQMAISSSGLTENLEATEKTLKKDNISTAFYPETARIDRSKNELIIEGKFLSYFGRSQKPVVTQKKFALGWKILSRGQVAVSTLKEIKDEK